MRRWRRGGVIDKPLLVLHSFGDVEGGVPWAEELSGAGWLGEVVAPNLPGHGGEPPPVGGHYEAVDAFTLAIRALHVADLRDNAPVVVGIGSSGWSAWVLALAGRASALALVDGLGGPWLDADAAIADMARRARAIADDPLALAAPVDAAVDPRLAHGVPAQSSLSLARRAAAATKVPVALVESPASPSGVAARNELARLMRSPVIEVVAATPSVVAPALVAAAREWKAATARHTGVLPP